RHRRAALVTLRRVHRVVDRRWLREVLGLEAHRRRRLEAHLGLLRERARLDGPGRALGERLLSGWRDALVRGGGALGGQTTDGGDRRRGERGAYRSSH